MAERLSVATRILRGDTDVHIAAFGDSITYGAAQTGASRPKWRHSWPGRLSMILNTPFGLPGGTGIVVPWNTLETDPADDPRLRRRGDVLQLAGPGPADPPLRGPAGRGMWRISDDGAVRFSPPHIAAGFSVYAHATEAPPMPQARVDGHVTELEGEVLTRSADGAEIMRWSTPRGGKVLTIETRGDDVVDLWGIEAHAPGVRVTTFARNGIGTEALALDADDLGAGMPLHVDAARVDLAILLLGANDRTTESHIFIARVREIVARVRNAGGEALLITPPQFDYSDPLIGIPTVDARIADLEQVAELDDLPLIRLDGDWDDFARASRRGWFADGIHPSDAGLESIAQTVAGFLLTEPAPRR